ncbi:MAG: HD-GYP domain-containing protein [Solirubrobacterales bacterium]
MEPRITAGPATAGPANPPIQVDELRAAPLFAPLDDAALGELAARSFRQHWRPGEILFCEGDPGRTIYILTEGSLRVLRPTIDPDLVLSWLTAPRVFGEVAVLAGIDRTASVVSVEESATIGISAEALDGVLARHPRAARAILGTLATLLTDSKEQLARQNHTLEQTVGERTRELRNSQVEVVQRLAKAAESRDDATGAHIERMSALCGWLGRLAGLGATQAAMLEQAATMHDVGKIAVPDRVLLKEGPLDAAEWAIMKTHSTVGARMLSGSRSALVQMAESIALTHHERWDGSGYPNGLAGPEIPEAGRICALADVFDALTSERPYKQAWSLTDAREEIRSQSGRQFDPRLVSLFDNSFDEAAHIRQQVRDTTPHDFTPAE